MLAKTSPRWTLIISRTPSNVCPLAEKVIAAQDWSANMTDTTKSDLAPAGDDAVDGWTRRHVRALFEWLYGPDGMAGPVGLAFTPTRSRRTGRLRTLELDGRRAFIVGNDGIIDSAAVPASRTARMFLAL